MNGILEGSTIKNSFLSRTCANMPNNKEILEKRRGRLRESILTREVNGKETWGISEGPKLA